MQTPPPRFLSEEPAALSALAESASGQILEHLHRRGPATVAELAQALGEERATVKRQLDRLAAHRFVEVDTGRSKPRAGRWRAVAADLRLPQANRTPEADAVARAWFEPSLEALSRFVADGDPWAASATLSHSLTHLTQEELERFGVEYLELASRYARSAEEAPDEARPTTAILFAFPRAAQ